MHRTIPDGVPYHASAPATLSGTLTDGTREAPGPSSGTLAFPAPTTVPLWGVVLAGGQGIRLRSLVERLCGDARPKQYAPLLGTRSMLRQTLDRIALGIPSHRTLVVSVEAQAAYLAAETGMASTDRIPAGPRILLQPADRGTAAGVLLPAYHLGREDPDAIVAVFPSDHFVAEEHAFMAHVLEAARFVEGHPGRIVLLGAEATEPETEYGWIDPGETLGLTPAGPVRAVTRFLEKPTPAAAQAALARGGLWNTFVLVARIATLIDAGRRRLPDLHERLLSTAAVGASGPAALRRAYTGASRASFSTDVIQRETATLAVLVLAGVTWCDWGSPERVTRGLARLGVRL